MIRSVLTCAVVLGFGSFARAGELDKEVPPVKAGVIAAAPQASGSELDKESPTDAWHYRRGWGFRGGFPAYGFAHSGWHRPFAFGFPVVAPRPVFFTPTFYSPFVGYRSFYSYGFSGGFGFGGYRYYGW